MILPYIINVALILTACLVFYKLLLRRETFYRVNRYMLITCLAISFALPLLQVPAEYSLRKRNGERSMVNNDQPEPVNHQSSIGNQVPSEAGSSPSIPDKQNAGNKNVRVKVNKSGTDSEITNSNEVTTHHSPLTVDRLLTWLFWFYWFGVGLFAISFLFQVALLLRRAYRNPVIIDGKYRIVEVSGDKAPCSFGNNIFINPEKYDWETYNQILLHEKIHIEQRHTLDIMLAELVLIFQWFNPFAWVYRREMESNLEFLTDDELMQHNRVELPA